MPVDTEKLKEILGGAANSALDKLSGVLPERYMDSVGSYLGDVPASVRARMVGALERAATFKAAALAETDEGKRREYAAAVETAMSTFESTLLAEALVKENKLAAILTHGFRAVLDEIEHFVPALLSEVAAGVVKGAAQGLMGEGSGSLDPFR